MEDWARLPGKIFISYRRDDVPGDARGVRDALAAKFGKSSIFMDVDNLLAGQRFDEELTKALLDCDVLVAIMGPRWMDLLRAKSANAERDYVREEIARALRHRMVVIPVRVGREGQMPPLPRPAELLDDIRDLVLYQKHDVAHERFGRDVAALVEVIRVVRKSAAGVVTRPGVRPATLGWMAASAVGAVAVTWAVAYQAGVAVPWPSSSIPVLAAEKRDWQDCGKFDPDISVRGCTRTIERWPNHADAYYFRGLAYFQKGEYDQAIADYDQALRLKPDQDSAYNNRGHAYLEKGQYDRAIADYDQALRLNPGHAVSYNNRGRAYDEKQRAARR
jgi:tetratricopeptide (TPR) repeat protein